MFIFSEPFLTVYSNHFELENCVMTTPKRCLNYFIVDFYLLMPDFAPDFFFSCFMKILGTFYQWTSYGERESHLYL